MSWSINEVVRVSGVTSRTLRHYQAIGLLEPETTEFSGRRRYGHRELIRLQQILVLRELGLPLKRMAEILDSSDETSRTEALQSHLSWLRQERGRLDLMIQTVEDTIDKGDNMTPEQIFEGFAENPYESEARLRWGDEAVDSSKKRLANLSKEDEVRLRSGFAEVHEKIEALRAEGAPLDDPRVTAAVAEHHSIVSITWEPSPEAYAGLGRMYVEDERFRQTIGRGNDEMVAYLRDAMAVYAKSLG